MSITLEKGAKINLEKEAGGPLSEVYMGLGWDPAEEGESIDLDASCVLFDANRQVVDEVWFRQLRSRDGSIHHTGDNLTGDGDGDDEQIIVNLARVPANVEQIVFTVTSYRGQTFDCIDNATCRLVNKQDDKEIARYVLRNKGNHTGLIMAKLYRHQGQWKMAAIGETCGGRTVNDLVRDLVHYL